MRVIRGTARTPEADHAATAAAVDRTADDGVATLRVWSPPHHVCFGPRDANAAAYPEARAAVEAAGYEAVVRSTGGRPVAHTGETLAVALARPVEDIRTGLTERYDAMTGTLQRALWRLGVPAQRGEPADSFCPGDHSLAWRGKVAGVAQRVRNDVALVGAVVVVAGHEAVAEVLVPVYRALSVPLDPDAVGSIQRAGGRTDPEVVRSTIESAFVAAEAAAEEVEVLTPTDVAPGEPAGD